MERRPSYVYRGVRVVLIGGTYDAHVRGGQEGLRHLLAASRDKIEAAIDAVLEEDTDGPDAAGD